MEIEKHRLEIYRTENPNELTEAQFEMIEEEMRKPKKNTISDEYFDFKLWCRGLGSRQENFANYVARRLKRKDAKNILEVGSGRNCRLSRILQEKGYNITCIDPKIDLQFVEAKTTKLMLRKENFDSSYDLSKFDFIVAQEPCEATEHIVRACVNQNKPFVISLCGVPHTLISGKKLENVFDWYDYLVRISEDTIRLRCVSLDLGRTHILLND